eukprot:SAG11_NODE_34266_length_273_cov_0.557471_1_plen_37_part_10
MSLLSMNEISGLTLRISDLHHKFGLVVRKSPTRENNI